MAWRLTKEAEQWEPLPGVPWRDMEDEEFREVAKEYSERNGGTDHGFGPRALHGSGFFEHDEAKPSAKRED